VHLELRIAASDGQVKVSATFAQSAELSMSAAYPRRSRCIVLALIASDEDELVTPWLNEIPSR